MTNTNQTAGPKSSQKKRKSKSNAPAAVSPADEPPLTERIVRKIADEIVSGERAPGSHLNEQALADQFGISRTPIREAIRQLVAADLVEIAPRRGAFVARISVKRLIQMFEFMSELEGVCARIAARRMTSAEKEELQNTHESYKKYVNDDDPTEYFDASLAFHRQIYAGAKNEPLEMATRQLYDRLTPYRRRQLLMNGRTEKSFKEHEEVLEAIMKGDGKAAELAMRGHTGIVVDNVMELITSLSDE